MIIAVFRKSTGWIEKYRKSNRRFEGTKWGKFNFIKYNNKKAYLDKNRFNHLFNIQI